MRTLVAAALIAAFTTVGQQTSKPPEQTPPEQTTPATTTQPPTKPFKPATQYPPKEKRETPAEWFHRVTGIDLRAYSNITAVRQQNGIDPAPQLVQFDRKTGKEKILWKCGACWSPARIEHGTVVLRQAPDDPTGAEIWLVRDRGTEPKRIASVPAAVAIAGASKKEVFVGATRERCGNSSEGPYGIVSVAVADGAITELPDAPCFGLVSLVSSSRVRGDRYLATTRRSDLSGNPRPRQLLIMSPATGKTPTATYFDERLKPPPDRYDAVWVDEHRIVYLAKP